ncbi:MAG TPA: hypothetical protein VHQ47_06470 [Phycisphaerae bacterium]|nr:hypothetical protein [Phycisphaerae bacterium]
MNHRLVPPWLLFALFLALLFPGCAAYRPLQIESAKTRGYVISPRFDQAYYYADRDNTLYYILRSHTVDRATHQPVDQIFTLRIFWRPIGGKTSLQNTALNATYRYALMTPTSVGLYEGAGFVRLYGKNGKHRLPIRIMDGDLRLTQASSNFQDNIGRARIRGNINATFDDARAVDLLHQAQQDFFAKSLQTAVVPVPPSTGPASTSQPSTFPSPFLLPAAPPAATAPSR